MPTVPRRCGGPRRRCASWRSRAWPPRRSCSPRCWTIRRSATASTRPRTSTRPSRDSPLSASVLCVSDDAIMRPGYQVAGSVLDAIAQRAAEAVDGGQVLDRRMRARYVTFSVDGDRLSASLALQVRFGVVLPDAAEDARLRVAG